MPQRSTDWKQAAKRETEPLEAVNTRSNLSVVKVTTQGDITDQLRTVHQVRKKSAKREEEHLNLRDTQAKHTCK